MLFKFPFSNKKELIYVKETSQTEPIGSLLSHLIDTDWEAFAFGLVNRSETKHWISVTKFQAIRNYQDPNPMRFMTW